MTLPIFSVIVPTYNQAQYLPACLDSLLNQSFSDWEAIIVNDGSTDSTPLVLEHYARQDSRLRVLHKKNGGVATALNEGLRQARGAWICWLSSDDLFEPDKLQIHHDAALQNPTIRFMHTNYSLLYDESGGLVRDALQIVYVIPPAELQLLTFFRFNYINGISIAVRRDLFEAVGLFDEELRWGQDYDMWLRLTACSPSFFIDRHTSITRIHPGQETNLFVEAGILDSCRAAVAFLNTHPFAELFPLLNLDDPDSAWYVVEQTIRVLTDENAYTNRAGFGPLLAGRLQEWLMGAATFDVRTRLQVFIGRVKELVSASESATKAVLASFAVLDGSHKMPYRFVPQDFFCLLDLQVQRLAEGGDSQAVAAVRKYRNNCAQLGQHTDYNVSAEASRSLSILFVAHNFVPHNFAGVENYTFQMAKELMRCGHRVAVLYPWLESGAQMGILADQYDGITVYRLILGRMTTLQETLTNPDVEKLFSGLLQSVRFDLVHFQHTHLLLPLSLVTCAKALGHPVVFTLHDFWLICLRTHLFRGVEDVCNGPESVEKCCTCLQVADLDPVQFFAARREQAQQVFRAATLLTAPSQFVAGLFTRFGCDANIVVSPLGVVACQARQGATAEPLTFGFIGTINDIKNVFGLVHAFQQTSGEQARLRIYGHGSTTHIELLKAFISDSRVEYCGGYAPGEVCSILSQFHVTVVPSYIESYCITVRESLSAGVPVIASNVGGIPEIVTHLENGILFNPNQLAALTAWIQTCIDTPEMVEHLRKQIRPVKTIAQDAEQWSGRYLDLSAGPERNAPF